MSYHYSNGPYMVSVAMVISASFGDHGSHWLPYFTSTDSESCIRTNLFPWLGTLFLLSYLSTTNPQIEELNAPTTFFLLDSTTFLLDSTTSLKGTLRMSLILETSISFSLPTSYCTARNLSSLHPVSRVLSFKIIIYLSPLPDLQTRHSALSLSEVATRLHSAF